MPNTVLFYTVYFAKNGYETRVCVYSFSVLFFGGQYYDCTAMTSAVLSEWYLDFSRSPEQLEQLTN